MGFSRQEYWSGLPFFSPGDLLNPEIEPRSLALQEDSLPTELWGKLLLVTRDIQIKTTVRYYFPPSRIVTVEKREDSKCMWRNWDPFIHLAEIYNGATALGHSLFLFLTLFFVLSINMSLKSIRHDSIKEQCTRGQIPDTLKMHVFMHFFLYLNIRLRYKIYKTRQLYRSASSVNSIQRLRWKCLSCS